MKYGLIVHGGAWSIPDDVVDDHRKGVENACGLGYSMLEDKKTALDVVEEVIKMLENDPTFDAGKGSHLNNMGEVEMDAIIADQNYNIGSVCAIQNVANPISVARKVMENTEHVVLVGKGATDFAHRNGIEPVQPEDLLVGRELKTYQKLQRNRTFSTKDPFDPKKQGFGTVGVVVRDHFGKFAIGVSTGGTPNKLAGRVGDTPIWGAGGFVNPTGGVAATGFGEDLLRILISQRVVSYIESGLNAQPACEKAIEDLHQEVNGLGGVISVSNNGLGLAFNTKRMAYAFQTNKTEMKVGINPEDLKLHLRERLE